MPKKPQRLNEILDTFAPQGSNDARWFLVEHQLEQLKMSARTVLGCLRIVAEKPENEEERLIAEDCLAITEPLLVEILETWATLLSYLSGTDVSERISRKEL